MDDGRPMVCSALDAARSAAGHYDCPASGSAPGYSFVCGQTSPSPAYPAAAEDPQRSAALRLVRIILRPILVTQYPEVAALADGFTVVMNYYPELGISRSMQLGIQAAGDADAYMFCVCDQPGITACTMIRLIDAYLKASSDLPPEETVAVSTADDSFSPAAPGRYKYTPAPIISLAWQGKMYNPKIFSSYYRDELMRLTGDTGGRQIIASHLDSLVLVEASGKEEITDIDTPL